MVYEELNRQSRALAAGMEYDLQQDFQMANEIYNFIASRIGEVLIQHPDTAHLCAYDVSYNGLIEKMYLVIYVLPRAITQLADAYEAVPEYEWADVSELLKQQFLGSNGVDKIAAQLMAELPSKFPDAETGEFLESNILCYINDILFVAVPSIEMDTSTDDRLSLAWTYMDLPDVVDRLVTQAFNNAGMAYDYGQTIETGMPNFVELRMFDTSLSRFEMT